MKLYIIRHGETQWNVQRRLQGQTDIELNENGRALARVTSQALGSVSFDLAYTSPLARAVETARIILGNRKTPLICDERIQEVGFGELEGKPFTEMQDDSFHCFFDAPEKYCPPKGGESIDQLYVRTGKFLEELRENSELFDKTILVSTHGAASRALLANITHCARADFWGGCVPKNCAVSIVELTDGAWVLAERDKIYY